MSVCVCPEERPGKVLTVDIINGYISLSTCGSSCMICRGLQSLLPTRC